MSNSIIIMSQQLVWCILTTYSLQIFRNTSWDLFCIHKEYQPITWHIPGLWWDAIYLTALYNSLDSKQKNVWMFFQHYVIPWQTSSTCASNSGSNKWLKHWWTFLSCLFPMNIIIQGLILEYKKIFAMLAFWQCMVLLIPKIGKKRSHTFL